MPTLHLPAAHTDTDVALATEVAHVVGSCELYVTWTHGEGPGLPPEIETITEDEYASRPAITPFGELVVAMAQGISALWNAIVRPQAAREELPAPREERRGGPPRRRRAARVAARRLAAWRAAHTPPRVLPRPGSSAASWLSRRSLRDGFAALRVGLDNHATAPLLGK